MIIGNFLAGLLVGTLLGLAIAPIARSWLVWKTVEESRRADDSVGDAQPKRVDRMEQSDSI